MVESGRDRRRHRRALPGRVRAAEVDSAANESNSSSDGQTDWSSPSSPSRKARSAVGGVTVDGNARRERGAAARGAEVDARGAVYEPRSPPTRRADAATISTAVRRRQRDVVPVLSPAGSRADLTFQDRRGPADDRRAHLHHRQPPHDPGSSRGSCSCRRASPWAGGSASRAGAASSALGLFRRIQITRCRTGAAARDVLVTVEEAPATTIGYGGGLEASRLLRAGPGRRGAGAARARAARLLRHRAAEPRRQEPIGRTCTRASASARSAGAGRNRAQGLASANTASSGPIANRARSAKPTSRSPARSSRASAQLQFRAQRRQRGHRPAPVPGSAPAAAIRSARPAPSTSGSTRRSRRPSTASSRRSGCRPSRARLAATRATTCSTRRGAFLSAEGDGRGARARRAGRLSQDATAGLWFQPAARPPRIVFATRARGRAGRRLRACGASDRRGWQPDPGPPWSSTTCPPANGSLPAATPRSAASRSTRSARPTISANGFPLGGNAVVILNGELRVPVWRDFGAALFVDGGNVFARVTT